MATQRQRGGRLELKAYAGVDPATGRSQYVYDSVAVGIGRRELDRRIRALDARAAELAEGRRARRKDPQAQRPKKVKARTCGEAVEVWWAKHGAKLASAPKTRTLVDSILLPEFGTILVSLVAGTPPDDEDDRDPDLVYLSERWREVAERRDLEPSTVHRCHGILGGALRRAGHPVPDPGLPSIGEAADTTPLAEEMAAFLAFLAEPPVTPAYRVARRNVATYDVPARVGERSAMDLMVEAFALLVMSGPRPVEASALTRDRLDISTGRCSFDGRGVVLHRGEDGAEAWVVATGESAKRRKRAVTLDPRAAGALNRWLRFQDEYALAAGQRLRSRSFVFSLVADASVPLSPKVMSKAFARQVGRARAAGVELPDGFHLYSCRHFGISQLLRAGHDVTAVAKRFGTSARMVHQTYGHCIDADDSRLAESLGALWAEPAGEVVRFPGAGVGPGDG
jgi:hypothetical protein